MEQLGQFITNHLLLCLAFIGVLIVTIINELLSTKKKANEVSPQVAVDMMNHEHAVVIDLRDKEAFDKGHIIDALHAKEDDFSQAKMTKYKNKKLILVCANGLQSAASAAKLHTQGFQTFVLGGGINAWKTAELPLVKK